MEPNHFEGEGLRPIVGWTPKGDGQIDLPKWHDLLSRHDAMERRFGWPDERSVDAHSVERLGVHDVEVVASIHQKPGEPLRANEWVDHERVPPRLWDTLRVIGLIEGYGGL